MTTKHIPFEQVRQLSHFDKLYASQASFFEDFLENPPTLLNIPTQIEARKKAPFHRHHLVEVLEQQYENLANATWKQQHLSVLADENTFTITTAHQPVIYLGPLYTVYKILSAIKLAEICQNKFPKYRFVPIFIIGGEDHDFEEINHTRIFGKRVNWSQEKGGAVGRLSTESLQESLETVIGILGESEQAKALTKIFSDAYHSSQSYAKATQHLIHALFGKYGLVTLNTDSEQLKSIFIPFIKKEIFEQVSQKYVQSTQEKLAEHDLKAQAYAREINFFFHGNGYRERIVAIDDKFAVNGQDITYSKEELTKEIENNPSSFSPNVVMRPLYQELVLPNIAYVGGGGELAYWLERKSQFKAFGLVLPMLIRRDSVLWIDKSSYKKIGQFELNLSMLLEDKETVIKQFVKNKTNATLSLSQEKKELQTIFDSIKRKAIEIDKTLGKSTQAELAKISNALEKLETKMLRAEKRNFDTSIQQIEKLYEKLFPNDGLQERYENFSSFYLKMGDAFFEKLLTHFNPLDMQLKVFIEDK